MQVTIAETGITSPGQSRRIKGEGMPVHNFPSDRGDLVVRYKLKMPGSLTDEQRQLLEKVRALRSVLHRAMLRSDGYMASAVLVLGDGFSSPCAKSDSPTVLAHGRGFQVLLTVSGGGLVYRRCDLSNSVGGYSLSGKGKAGTTL